MKTMTSKKLGESLGRLIAIIVVMMASSFAGWELTKSWAGLWLAFAVTGYLMDININLRALVNKNE